MFAEILADYHLYLPTGCVLSLRTKDMSGFNERGLSGLEA
jgi:hypothetical protein